MAKETSKENYTVKDFKEAYYKLCDEMGYSINFVLQYMKRDDGTFSTIVNPQIVKIKQTSEVDMKEEEETDSI